MQKILSLFVPIFIFFSTFTGLYGQTLSITPTSYNYGDAMVNYCSSTYSYILTNIGTGTATGSVSLTGTNSDQFQIYQGGGSFSLGAGESVSIVVIFCPTTGGSKTATLLADGTNCSDVSSSLSGGGLEIPLLAMSAQYQNYGDINVNDCSSTYEFVVTNRESGTATGSVYLGGMDSDQFQLISGGGSFSLGAGESVSIFVKFCPTTGGSKTAGVVAQGINCNVVTAEISGNGIPPIITQEVELTSGWNIFSLAASPNNPDMLQLLDPLVSSGVLVKAQNEQGNAVEQLPVIGWINNIGSWLATEGYYIKVNSSSTLSITGTAVSLPINIPLTKGWNILGYPVQEERDALTVLNTLIAENQLIKVQDENGNAVEQLTEIGWINNIGNFKMDEGYYLKVNTNTSLNLDEPAARITELDQANEKSNLKDDVISKATASHFTPVYTSPYLPMNIYVTEADLLGGGSLNAGDEIGIFDGNLCVGSYVLTEPINSFIAMIASMDDPTTKAIDGFTPGHKLSFKFWLLSTSTEVSNYTTNHSDGDSNFTSLGTNQLRFKNISMIELTLFKATVYSNKVILSWETATEVNNYGFEVERRTSDSWIKIGFIKGSGNSKSSKSYIYIDNKLVGSCKFEYRLKQIDTYGKYKYSDVLAVEVVPSQYELMQNYPNPFNATTKIGFSVPEKGNVKLSILNLLGEELLVLLNEEKEAGYHAINFNANELSSGVYFYKIQIEKFTDTKKMVLLK